MKRNHSKSESNSINLQVISETLFSFPENTIADNFSAEFRKRIVPELIKSGKVDCENHSALDAIINASKEEALSLLETEMAHRRGKIHVIERDIECKLSQAKQMFTLVENDLDLITRLEDSV